MARRTFATFDPAAMSAYAELELSRLVVTHNVATTSQARSTLAQSSGKWYVEALIYGDGTIDEFNRVGIAQASDGVNDAVGDGPLGYAYSWHDGVLYHDGGTEATLIPAVKGDVVGLLVDLDDSPPTLSVLINGAVVGSVWMPAASYHILACTTSSTAYGLRAFVNFGQRAPEYRPDGVNYGWYEDGSDPVELLVSTQSFTTTPTDTPPDTFYDGRIPATQQFSVTRSVRVWPWAESGGGRSSIGALGVINLDRGMDVIATGDYRDAVVVVRDVDLDQPFDYAPVVAVGVVDGVVFGDETITLRLRDKLRQLDNPLQTRLFLPNAAEGAANQPYPVCLGTARNVPPVLYDEATRAYAISDQPVNTIASVRDKGDPLDRYASPADWTYNETGSGFLLYNDPQGKVAADVSSSGGSGIVDAPDAILAIGDPFVWTGSPSLTPDDWSSHSGFNSSEYYGPLQAGDGICRLQHGPSGPIAHKPRISPSSPAAPLTIGQTYRLRVTVVGVSSSSMLLGVVQTNEDTATGSPYYEAAPADRVLLASGPGSYVAVFTATATNVYVYGMPTSYGAGGTRYVDISDLTIEDVVAGNVDDANQPLAGITLPDFAQEVIERRAGFTSSDWSRASAEAVDVSAYDCGIYARDPISMRQALDAVIDSYTGFWFQGRDGVIRFGRLDDPEGADSPSTQAWDFDAGQVLGEVSAELDTAPGLSTSVACRRNWSPYGDSDFVTDTVDVPLEIRARFSRDHQFTRTSAINLAEPYRHALSAAPFPMLIDDPDDAQAEIDRVCSLYTVSRHFYSWVVGVSDDGAEFTIEPGDIVRLTYPLPGLDAGRRLMVSSITADLIRRTVAIVAWG